MFEGSPEEKDKAMEAAQAREPGKWATVMVEGPVEKDDLPPRPLVVCAVHGEHRRVRVKVTGVGEDRTYPFCPFCWGEWMAKTFPVTDVR